MPGFDEATAVHPRPGGADLDTTLDPDWTVAGRPNGGYLLAVLARAAATVVVAGGGDHPDPLAVSGTYLQPPSPGPAVVRTDVLRRGRSASHVRAVLEQDGTPCVDAVLILSRLSADAAPLGTGMPPPAMAAEADCVLAEPAVTGRLRMASLGRISLRLDPATAGFLDGRPSGVPEIRGWMRWGDGSDAGPRGLLFAVDALPPATFEMRSTAWVPTLQLTSYVRAVPAPGPLRVRQRAQLVQGGFVDETCEVWDSRDRLVAQATQLAGIRFPDDPGR